MPWLRFKRDFIWSPAPLKGRWARKFQKGAEALVPNACADEALSKGAAIKLEKSPLDLPAGPPDPESFET